MFGRTFLNARIKFEHCHAIVLINFSNFIKVFSTKEHINTSPESSNIFLSPILNR